MSRAPSFVSCSSHRYESEKPTTQSTSSHANSRNGTVAQTLESTTEETNDALENTTATVPCGLCSGRSVFYWHPLNLALCKVCDKNNLLKCKNKGIVLSTVERYNIDDIVCQNCLDEVGSVICRECHWAPYCNSCDPIVHKARSKSSHSRKALSSLLTVEGKWPKALLPKWIEENSPLECSKTASELSTTSSISVTNVNNCGQQEKLVSTENSETIANSVRKESSKKETHSNFSDYKVLQSPKTKTTGRIRQLIGVVEDSVDVSVVEKILVNKSTVKELCNTFSDCSTSDIGDFIDFSLLKKTLVSTLGVFGSRRGIVEFLYSCSILSSTDYQSFLNGEEMWLSKGIYVVIRKQSPLVLFVWLPYTSFLSPSMKDISCNFIRYLQELCSQIICVNSKEEWETFASTQLRDETDEIEREIYGSVELQSEKHEKLRFGSSHSVCLPDDCDSNRCFMSSGIFRHALLVEHETCVEKEIVSRTERFTLPKFHGFISDKLKSRKVIFNLSNEEFLTLLKYGHESSYARYQTLCQTLNECQKELQKELSKVPSKITEERDMWVERAKNAMVLFLNENFPIEERLVRTNATDENAYCVMCNICVSVHNGRMLSCSKGWHVFCLDDFQTLEIKEDISASFIICSYCGEEHRLPSNNFLNDDRFLLGVNLKHMQTSPQEKEEMSESNQAELKLVNDYISLEEFSPKLVVQDLRERYCLGRVFILKRWGPAVYISRGNFGEQKKLIIRVMTTKTLKEWYSLHSNPEELKTLVGEALRKFECSLAQGKPFSNDGDVQEIVKKTYGRERHNCILKVQRAILAAIPSYESLVSQRSEELRAKYRERYRTQTGSFLDDRKYEMTKDSCGDMKLIIKGCAFIEAAHGIESHAEDSSEKRLSLTSYHNSSFSLDSTNNSFEMSRPFSMPNGEIVLTYEEECISRPKTVIDVIEIQVLNKDLQRAEADQKAPLKPCFSPHRGHLLIDSKAQELKHFTIVSGNVFISLIFDKGDGYTRLFVDRNKSLLGKNRLKTFKSRIDLFALDEFSRFVALYDSERARVDIYRFDESWQRLEKTSTEIHLDQVFHDVSVCHMFFLTSKSYLIFIDEEGKMRSYEFSTKMFRPRTINTKNVEGVLSAPDGSCFMLLKKRSFDLNSSFSSTSSSVVSSRNIEDETASIYSPDKENDSDWMNGCDNISFLEAEIYIGGGMQYFGLVKLPKDFSEENIDSLRFSFLSSQLILYYLDRNNNCLKTSQVHLSMDNSLAEIVTNMNNLSSSERRLISFEVSVISYLEYIFLSMDKFCISPVLENVEQKKVDILVLLNSTWFEYQSLENLTQKFHAYVETKMEKFVEQTRKVKDVKEIPIRIRTYSYSELPHLFNSITNNFTSMLSKWVQDVICLVPIQIARAEANSFRPLIDGLRGDFEIERQEILHFANSINFGMYDCILYSWQGPTKVLSSMGKQSTGKSYMLNHLTGSLFDIAGGRCTDGVWMTMRIAEDCLYVILDFEGLGSFERSEQEDMLLSVFQAAISNLTLYKTDLRFDRDTQATFSRFQSGVSLIRGDPSLFRGRFYIVMKDVESRDVNDLQREFLSKLRIVCRNNGDDNFLTKMYQGQFAMAAFPTLGTRKYYEQLNKIYEALKKQPSSFQSGKMFRRHLQLLMSKLCTKDWTPLNRDQALIRISELRNCQSNVLNWGKMNDNSGIHELESLSNLDTGYLIADENLLVDGKEISSLKLPDEELQLDSDCKSFVELCLPLVNIFEKCFHNRYPVRNKLWRKVLQEFLCKVVERRIHRIDVWLNSNLEGYNMNDGDVMLLRHEYYDSYAKLRRQWNLCSFRCSRCYLDCLNSRNHLGEHNCLTSHRCESYCDFCKQSKMETQLCGDVAGHGGYHDCKIKNHTCGVECSLSHLEGCNFSCSLPFGHSCPHRCNAEYHLCGFPCDLHSCTNRCVHPFESEHSRHECHESWCPYTCCIPGCNKPCAETENHFHDSFANFVEHFCGAEHPCSGTCSRNGICQIVSELRPNRRIFRGALDEFEYVFVTEQNGLKKKCGRFIPPFRKTHEGHCDCGSESEHFCDIRCPSCGYFCIRSFGHPEELHHTIHGNMRACHFVSDELTEAVEVGSRRYKRGESGEAEMCNMYCKALGRGHIHLMYCNALDAFKCTNSQKEGIRHQTVAYGPDFNVPKDELTHECYWRTIGFVDPATSEEREIFALCPVKCGHLSHQTELESPVRSDIVSSRESSYCNLPLWHMPLDPKGPVPNNQGYISSNGHYFHCSHSSSYRTIFLLDRGASMATKDCSPTLPIIRSLRVTHRNRLGCAVEAIFRFIMKRLGNGAVEDRVDVIAFKERANICVYEEPLSERLIMKMVRMAPSGVAMLESGLEAAFSMIQEQRTPKLIPMLLLVTDGNVEVSPIAFRILENMLSMDKRITFHVVKFGNGKISYDLQQLCERGHGQLLSSLDEVALMEQLDSVTEKMQYQEGGLVFDSLTLD
ncbi:hypothetical protein Gasu2_62280 [Galdieria sulphuraria]|uniref:VWFA domain-containing protein n=1 Tax=Galdieria sulphuraria TaxID=130081 RepID=M2WVR7_GALSU|nr:uncharacterized protein Gasu_44170 [Galdieria sulphuraria]EME28080.1 hypothetical protein Gasu_44170 [Galdieria sulphuraria]GJD12116.1 hypothetical protein Gasu2_62280 [Galdieria sulphuraria]|eukprot:XP_005704600.1 hypothetical protein Gasu_44170 [Galdieria sulphuraria]